MKVTTQQSNKSRQRVLIKVLLLEKLILTKLSKLQQTYQNFECKQSQMLISFPIIYLEISILVLKKVNFFVMTLYLWIKKKKKKPMKQIIDR